MAKYRQNSGKIMGNEIENCPVLTVSKSELRQILKCPSDSRWYGKIMTPETINNVLGVSVTEYNSIREFTVSQTRSLYKYFQLQFDEYFNKDN